MVSRQPFAFARAAARFSSIMIFYFDFAMYLRMVRLSLKETNPKGRRRLLITLFFVIPILSGFTAICFFLDKILFPGLWKIEVRQPVFMVGHARSGTTLLHRILARDVDRFSYFMLYELFFPSLLQKKIIRGIASLDTRFDSPIGRRIRAWEERSFGKTNDLHRMGLTLAEEDDFIFTLSCASGYWIVLLPYMGRLDFYHVDERPARSRRRLMEFYGECVKRQLYLNGPGKQHLSKNPTFCGRVGSIIETFPDSRIVYLARNPEETIPSLLKLMQTTWAMRGWTEDDMRASLQTLAYQSYESYTAPLEVLERNPQTKHAIVDYRELVKAPRETVTQVYRELGFPISPAFEEILLEEEKRSGRHETTHRYSLDEFGLDAGEIQAELAPLFDRFEWPRSPIAKPR